MQQRITRQHHLAEPEAASTSDSRASLQPRSAGLLNDILSRESDPPSPSNLHHFGALTIFPAEHGRNHGGRTNEKVSVEQNDGDSPVDESTETPLTESPDLLAHADSADGRTVMRDTPDGGTTTSGPDATAAIQAFVAHGVYGPQTLQPPTGIGGFEAAYNPATKVLNVTVRAAIEYQNGLTLDPSSHVITANHTDLTQAATDGMALAEADRARFVQDFTWTDPAKTDFSTRLVSSVQSAWTGQYTFQCTTPGWSSVTSAVVAHVEQHTGPRAANDHLHVSPYKVPDGGTYSVGAVVNSHTGQPNNSQLDISSTDVQRTPQENALLRRSVQFANNSSVLDAAANGTLNQFIADFKVGNAGNAPPVQLVGHASSTGTAAHNRQLAQQRVDSVRAFLTTNHLDAVDTRIAEDNEGATGATADASFRRVDLIVGSGEGQLVAAHEFGHVFGLKDEYATNPGGAISGTGNATGTIVGHSAMAQAIGTTGAIAENNDNIMSLGNTVRPQHYSTFGWALGQVTGINQWQVR